MMRAPITGADLRRSRQGYVMLVAMLLIAGFALSGGAQGDAGRGWSGAVSPLLLVSSAAC